MDSRYWEGATSIRRLIAEMGRGDIQELVKAGWRAPEVFTSLARDGKTDIWDVIFRPSNFDPLKKHPVIEYIYAGPQGSFVPKSSASWTPTSIRPRRCRWSTR